MDTQIEIEQFLDSKGKIIKLPRKQKPRLAVLEYLASKFDNDRIYTEHEVNDICGKWHTFDDFYLLRRELVDCGFLDRKKDCSQYWKKPAGENISKQD